METSAKASEDANASGLSTSLKVKRMETPKVFPAKIEGIVSFDFFESQTYGNVSQCAVYCLQMKLSTSLKVKRMETR